MITFRGLLNGRVVLKYGTNALTRFSKRREVLGLHRRRIGDIAHLARILHDNDVELIVVSSGAMVAAMAERGIRQIPEDEKERQDLATDGQQYLGMTYAEALERQGMGLRGLLLVTYNTFRNFGERASLLDRIERGFAEATIRIPVLNTNDAVTNKELAAKSRHGFSDNDPLAARVARYCRAYSLIIVSEEGEGGSGGTGSKIKAFRYAERHGIKTNRGVMIRHKNIEDLMEDWENGKHNVGGV